MRYSITVRQTKTVRAAIAEIPEHDWVHIAYQPSGVAQVAETPYRGDRLIVRRVRNLGDQQQLFPTWRYHGFVTDRVGTATWLDADHRRHAVCELAIRDLKAGAGLAHLPSGQFNANATWLLAATLAHNLLRWTATLGLGTRNEQIVAKTLRRTLLHAARPAHPLGPPLEAAPARRLAVGTHLPDGAGPAALYPATRPDRTPTPRLGLLAAADCSRLPARRREDHPAAQRPAAPTSPSTLRLRVTQRERPHPSLRRVKKPPTAPRDRWIQAEIGTSEAAQPAYPLPRHRWRLAHSTMAQQNEPYPLSSWRQHRQPVPPSSSPAVPLACHSQQSRSVPSGQPRTTPRPPSPAALPRLARWRTCPIWLWEQGVAGSNPAVPTTITNPLLSRGADGPSLG